MKKILSVLVLVLTLTSLSAQTSKLEVKSVVVVETSVDEVKMAGVRLEQAGKLKNTAIIMTLIGGAFVGMGTMIDDADPVMVLGGVIMVTSLPLNIIANSKMVRSGRTLKRFE